MPTAPDSLQVLSNSPILNYVSKSAHLSKGGLASICERERGLQYVDFVLLISVPLPHKGAMCGALIIR